MTESELDRALIRRLLRDGFTPDQVHAKFAKGRQVYLAALEEEARLVGELGTFEPSDEVVRYLRDRRRLRWERIAVRVFGDARKTAGVRALYDKSKVPGASSKSYTGRGRRFESMEDEP
jgi:hypothetical protein